MRTLVAVQCFAGDASRVENALEQYIHHDAPVLILSPTDAPVQISHPQVTCRTAGLNGYNEAGALARYRAQMELMLEYDAAYYLLNESDSFCLSEKIPSFLYANDDVVWSNVTDVRYYLEMKNDPDVERAYLRHNPAMNAPWFFSRRALERMLAVYGAATAEQPAYLSDDVTWWFHSAVHYAGLQHRSYDGVGVCRPILTDADVATSCREIQNGAVMIHAVKDLWVLDALVAAYRSLSSVRESIL